MGYGGDHAKQYNEQALHLIKVGEFDQAIRFLDNAIRIDDKRAIFYYNRARASIGMGDFDEAATDCKKALALDPDKPAFHHGLGEVYMQQDRYQEALAAFEKASELRPENATYLFGRGHALSFLNRHRESNVLFGQAIRRRTLDPEISAWAPVHIGSNYLELGDWDRSVRHFEKAIKLDPNNLVVYSDLGYCLLEQGNPQGAIYYLEESVRRGGAGLEEYCNISRAYMQLKEFDEAEKYLAIAIEKNASSPIPHSILGDLYRSKGDNVKARKNYDWVLHIVEAIPKMDRNDYRAAIRAQDGLGLMGIQVQKDYKVEALQKQVLTPEMVNSI